MRDIGHADFALLLSASRVPTRGERLDNSHSGRWVLCSSTGTSGFRSRGSDESASSLRIRIPARKPSQDKQRSKNLIFSSSQLHCEDACVRLRATSFPKERVRRNDEDKKSLHCARIGGYRLWPRQCQSEAADCRSAAKQSRDQSRGAGDRQFTIWPYTGFGAAGHRSNGATLCGRQPAAIRGIQQHRLRLYRLWCVARISVSRKAWVARERRTA